MECYSTKGNFLVLKVKVTPGMRDNRLNGIKNEELLIHIKAQAEKDKANKELVKFLAKALDIGRSDIELVTGEHSHHKVIKLPGSALRSLKAFIGKDAKD
jgi:uncharacterized protein